jgi:ribosomal protein L10
VNRSKIPIETDDYYPKTGEFNELAKDLGVGLSAIKEQVARTVKGHIQQTIN